VLFPSCWEHIVKGMASFIDVVAVREPLKVVLVYDLGVAELALILQLGGRAKVPIFLLAGGGGTSCALGASRFWPRLVTCS